MTSSKLFDVIIIGGSYAGLSAAMALGRSLRNVLIIDSGQPCNKQTPHSHNFITQDGRPPKEILHSAKEQVLNYDTVRFYDGLATEGIKSDKGFEIKTSREETFAAKKLVFATGISDIMPSIQGFAECWGISIIHCPYCHGYEYRGEQTGILANGDIGFEITKMISNWTKDLTVFTNGPSTFTGEQFKKIEENNIKVIQTEIESVEHTAGRMQSLVFKDKSKVALKAAYARVGFTQHCHIPAALGCEFTEQGYLKIDLWQVTSVPGVFACGDNSTYMRSLANAVYSGSLTGVVANKELIEEEF